jgi:hypothetical protein
VGPVWAQTPPAPAAQATPAAQPAAAIPPPQTTGPSQVFPDGGFANSPLAAAADVSAVPPTGGGSTLAAAAKVAAAQAAPPAQEKPPSPDYAPPGLTPRGVQEAPGVPEFFRQLSAPMPDYFYDPSYYERPGVGARPIADYAPPGFEPREGEEGQAPGVPEFAPIPAPVPITQEERQKFVTRGMFPGSYLVPGTNTSFRFRGFVRLTGLYDFDPIGSRDDFVTNTIPVPQQSGQNQNFSARYSRIGLDTWTPTTIFDWNVHTFIEADFFNGPAQAAGGGGNPFRLRFAFVDFGWFRVGQQNTVFMDSNAFPMTVDFAGPRGLANLRRPSVRVTIPLADKLFWAIGVEQPFSDITTNGLGTPVQDIPDFATHLRYETDFGHVQLSTIVRSIEFRPTDGETERRGGWGLSASTVFHPWALLMCSSPVRKDNPTGLERSRILLQYTFGWGIGRYIQDTAGQGLDGQVDPVTDGFATLYASGWSASYEHWFTEKWLSNITYSETLVGFNGAQPDTTYLGAKYLAASLWYVPFRNMSIGLEYDWGERKNLNEDRGRANRINGLVQYNF